MPIPLSVPAATPVAEVAAAPDGAMSSGENRTERLYRAALGPVNCARYLQVFEAFDAAGRRGLVWHPAAAFFTLGWLVFRRLWVEALAYALALALVVGLGIWAWPSVQTWPPGVRWGLAGALALVLVLAPGLTGYGLVHRQVQRRLLQVVAAARSLDDACATLSRHGATGRRLWLVASASVLALLVSWWWLWGRTPPIAPPQARDVPAAVTAADAAMPSQLPAVPAGTPDGQPVVVEPPLPSEPVDAVNAVNAVDVPASPPVVADATPPEPGPPPPAAPAAPEGGYAINVGLFANPDNARRVQERLQQAQLPVTLEETASARGARWRVRVGPFEDRSAADEAARQIRALGLEAVVFSR